MTQQELDALQALCDGATAGPWELTKDGRYEDHDECRINLPNDTIELCSYENGEFIAVARTAMPKLIEEVRKLTREAEFLRKAYREKSALIRLLIDTQALAQTVAEGPYKDYYDRVAPLPNCNDCGREACEYKPRWGDQVRINCPLHIRAQPAKEDDQ